MNTPHSSSPAPGGRDGGPEGRPLLFLVEDDPDQRALIGHWLAMAGYGVRGFKDAGECLSACRTASDGRPAAMLVDMYGAEHDVASALVGVARLAARAGGAGVPLVCFSARGDLETRVAAIRAGARRFLEKPLDREELLEVLDGITGRRPADPYRVLLVMDDAAWAERRLGPLAAAGMECLRVADPLKTLEAVAEFDADVILLGFDSPACTPLELARALRDIDAYARIPLLFFADGGWSAEEGVAVAELGGSGIVSTAAAEGSLVNLVTARARRSRHLRRIEREVRELHRDRENQQFALDQHAIVSATDPAGRITYVNDKFCQISGYSREELIGENHRIVNSGYHPRAFFAELWATVGRGEVWHGEVRNRRRNGDFYWVEATVVPFMDEAGKPYKLVSIRTDITHIKAYEAALRIARDEAESAARAKEELLARVSHEFRTPLNAIHGFGQLLQTDPNLDEEQADSVNEIVVAGEKLTRLVDGVIELSNIESGKFDLEIEEIPLGGIVGECLGGLAGEAGARGVTLRRDDASFAGVTVQADYRRLRQVLDQLCGNAVRFNRPGGRVVLRAEAGVVQAVRLWIEDTGVGIPEALHDGLFTPFNRLDVARIEGGGNGIGLVIGRRLVEAMMGRIGFDSEEGVGSRFWLELPGRVGVR